MNVRKFASILLLCASPAAAMEWLSSEELERSCDTFLAESTGADAALCLAYIQGFLAGVDAAPRPAQRDTGKTAKTGSESYSERAARTRLGTLRLMQLRAARNPKYCLDESLTAVDIVETVAAYLKDHEEALLLTNAEAVYQALVHEYPCET